MTRNAQGISAVTNRQVATAADGVHDKARNAAEAKFLFEVFPSLFGAVPTNPVGLSGVRSAGLFAEAPRTPIGIVVPNSGAAIEKLFTCMRSITDLDSSAAGGGGGGGGGASSSPELIDREECERVIAFCHSKAEDPIVPALDSGMFYHSLTGEYKQVFMPLKNVLAAIATLVLDEDNIYFGDPAEKAARVHELFKSIRGVMLTGVCHTGQRDAIIGVVDSVKFSLDGKQVSYRFPESTASYFASLQVKYIEQFLMEQKQKSFEKYNRFMLSWVTNGSLDEGSEELTELKVYLSEERVQEAINLDLLAVGLCPSDADVLLKKQGYFNEYLGYVEPPLGSNTYWQAVNEIIHMSEDANVGRAGRLKFLQQQIEACASEEEIARLQPQLLNFIRIEATRRYIKNYKNIVSNVVGSDVVDVIAQAEAIIVRYDAAGGAAYELTDEDLLVINKTHKIVSDFKKNPLTHDIEYFFAALLSDQRHHQAQKLNESEFVNKFIIDGDWIDRYFPLAAEGSEFEFSLYTANKIIAYALTHAKDEWPARAQAVLCQLITYFETRLGVDEADSVERERHRLLKETSYPEELLSLLKLLVGLSIGVTEGERIDSIKKALIFCVEKNMSAPIATLMQLLPVEEKGRFFHGNENDTGDDYGNAAPIIQAAFQGYHSVISALITEGADVNAAAPGGFTALYAAAEGGHLEVVNALLAREGIDVNAAAVSGYTALHVAAHNGHLEVVKALLAIGGIDVNAEAAGGCTALYTAAQGGHIEVVNALLASRGINVNAAASSGHTALHVAAHNGHLEVVKALLAIGGIDVNAEAAGGCTALYTAAQGGHLEVVNALLAKEGIDVNAEAANGYTALYIAAEGGHLEVVKALLASPGIEVNKARPDGATALFLAAQNGHIEIVKLLPINVTQLTVNARQLRLFVSEREPDIQGRMVSHIGGANDDDIVRTSPCEIAAIMGHDDIVALLNEHKPIVDTYRLFSAAGRVPVNPGSTSKKSHRPEGR